MTWGLITATGSAWLLGSLLVAWLSPPVRGRRDAMLVLALGVLAGLGGASGLFFFAALVFGRPRRGSGTAELVLIAFLIWRLRVRASRDATAMPAAPVRMTWIDWALATALVQMTIVAAVVAWRAYKAEPYGGWDAWAIWNLHARFILRAG